MGFGEVTVREFGQQKSEVTATFVPFRFGGGAQR